MIQPRSFVVALACTASVYAAPVTVVKPASTPKAADPAPAVAAPAPAAKTETDSAKGYTLKNKLGMGLTWGFIRYDGDYDNQSRLYARGDLRYNVTECAALRVAGGGGMLQDAGYKLRATVYDGTVTGIFQPRIGTSSWRPYLSTGVGLSTIQVNRTQNPSSNVWTKPIDRWIWSWPLEVGIEYLVTEQISLALLAEGQILTSDPDAWDNYRAGSGSLLERRDEVQRLAVSMHFYIDPIKKPVKKIVETRVDTFVTIKRDTVVKTIRDTIKVGPSDEDYDGVPNAKDKCPNTPRSVLKVDANGCPVIEMKSGANIVLQGINFSLGSAKIRSSSNKTLAKAAKAIKAAPTVKVEIQGHTDNSGTEAVNLNLSIERANAVMSALLKLGVPADQMATVGYGPTKPISDNATENGRAQNRRVEFKVTDK